MGSIGTRQDAVQGRPEFVPGDPAPCAGQYRLLNIFGAPTGQQVSVTTGQTLPPAPYLFRWELVARA